MRCPKWLKICIRMSWIETSFVLFFSFWMIPMIVAQQTLLTDIVGAQGIKHPRAWDLSGQWGVVFPMYAICFPMHFEDQSAEPFCFRLWNKRLQIKKCIVLISLIEEGNGVKNCIEKLPITQIFMFLHRYLHPKKQNNMSAELILGVWFQPHTNWKPENVFSPSFESEKLL